MYKLFNLSNHPMDLGKFEGGNAEMRSFMKKHEIDGIELIQSSRWNESEVPADLIKGMHLRFWPMWLDFWRGDAGKLAVHFENIEIMKQFYGGETRQAMVDYYREELKTAKQIGVKYVVFHVTNVEPEHCFSYDFTYTSEEVVDAAVELLNEVFEGFDGNFTLLFENLWWPGLTLLDVPLAKRLLDGVNYPHKGFMLDISHMMNTNWELASEEQAAEYVLDAVGKLGSLAGEIKGIHLNSSLSGSYVKSQLENRSLEGVKDFFKRYCDSYMHVLKIDRHVPFMHASIKKVIEAVNPEFLVYEFLTEKIEELANYIDLQNEVLWDGGTDALSGGRAQRPAPT